MTHFARVLMASLCFTASGVLAAEPNSGIVSIDPKALQSAASEPVADLPFMIVETGKGGTAGGVESYTSADKRFSAGLSKYDKLTLRLKDWPVDEFMHILEGSVEITDAAGNKQTYGPGDNFVMPKGFNGTWRQLGPLKKLQVSYNGEDRALGAHASTGSDVSTIADAVASKERAPANFARDRYRHPTETLTFFGIEPRQTVVEIWPGGGWYTEILAPYLGRGGKLYAAVPEADLDDMAKRKAARPALYRDVVTAAFPRASAGSPRVPEGSADVVLTFRNVHNWRAGDLSADKKDYSVEAFREMYAMLKPGGVLGIVDHRLPESASADRELSSGYIKESTVRRLAEAAGFRLVGRSEVNANPKDTADWPNGVWTLPPSLAMKDKDRDRYIAIGESDRMTLKFQKPQ